MAETAPQPAPVDPVVEIVALLADPSTSYWLKTAIGTALERDPFDAERDALILASLLTRHLDAVVARHFPQPG